MIMTNIIKGTGIGENATVAESMCIWMDPNLKAHGKMIVSMEKVPHGTQMVIDMRASGPTDESTAEVVRGCY